MTRWVGRGLRLGTMGRILSSTLLSLAAAVALVEMLAGAAVLVVIVLPLSGKVLAEVRPPKRLYYWCQLRHTR